MASSSLEIYYAALDRLKSGNPTIVPKGTKITNDAVSLEAGRKKGSIKKSRDVFRDLIADIDAASAEQTRPQQQHTERLQKAKINVEQLQAQLDASHAREISLLAELFELRKQLNKITGEKVLPIRREKVKTADR